MNIDLKFIESKILRIIPKAFSHEILINYKDIFLNIKHNLSLNEIIDFVNYIIMFKETFFVDNLDNVENYKICEEIIEYLENYISEFVFNTGDKNE